MALTQKKIQSLFTAFSNKDKKKILSYLADDCVLMDPNYPQREMKGKKAIGRGMDWAFKNLKKPGFKLLNCWIDGDKAALEMKTHHVFTTGLEIKFLQVFIVETYNEHFIRIQSFATNRPTGIGGAITKFTGLFWKLTGRA